MTFVSTLRQARGSARGSKKTLGSASRAAWQHPKGAFAVRRGGPMAACRDGRKSWLRVGAHAEGCPKPAILRLLLLPPCFPGSSERSGEAKSGPKGPLYAANFLEKKLERAKGFEPSTPTLARLPAGAHPRQGIWHADGLRQKKNTSGIRRSSLPPATGKRRVTGWGGSAWCGPAMG